MNSVAPSTDFTIQSLLLNADPVVQAVMAALALASLACWAVILEKAVIFRRLRREAKALVALAAASSVVEPEGAGMAGDVLRAGLPEWREGRDTGETAGEFRDRLERAMRGAVTATLR
ncbi:MAG: flagellar motor protein MotA, partial [Acetobacteraceae bacterium]